MGLGTEARLGARRSSSRRHRIPTPLQITNSLRDLGYDVHLRLARIPRAYPFTREEISWQERGAVGIHLGGAPPPSTGPSSSPWCPITPADTSDAIDCPKRALPQQDNPLGSRLPGDDGPVAFERASGSEARPERAPVEQRRRVAWPDRCVACSVEQPASPTPVGMPTDELAEAETDRERPSQSLREEAIRISHGATSETLSIHGRRTPGRRTPLACEVFGLSRPPRAGQFLAADWRVGPEAGFPLHRPWRLAVTWRDRCLDR